MAAADSKNQKWRLERRRRRLARRLKMLGVTNDFEELRPRLETERKRLIQELERLKTNVCSAGERQASSPWAKEDEHATEIAELRRRGALEKLRGDQLAKVEYALHKFDRGAYGVCDFCGHPIDPARLEALPQAKLCLNCKAHEASRKRQGDSGRKNSAYEESKAYPHYSVDALLEYYERVWEDEPKEG